MPGILAFDKWAAFTDTYEPYRRWILTGDAAAFDLQVGDYIYEVGDGSRGHPGVDDDDDVRWDGCLFQARRKGKVSGDDKVIRDLETWQVMQLFGGELPSWPVEGGALQRIRAALMDVLPLGSRALATVGAVMADLLRYMGDDVKDPPKPDVEPVTGPLALARRAGWQRCFTAPDAIPGTPIEAGDTLVYCRGAGKLDPDATLRYIAVPRECYPAIWPQVANRWTAHTDYPVEWGPRKLANSLRRSYGKMAVAKPESAPLVIIRSIRSPVSEPVAARSDAEALMELLAVVGGRLTNEDAA